QFFPIMSLPLRGQGRPIFRGPLVLAKGPFLLEGGPQSRPRTRNEPGLGQTMPKMKTHKGAKKRFRVTATGKLKRKPAAKQHLTSPKTGKRKRQLRAPVVEPGKLGRKYGIIMGGHA